MIGINQGEHDAAQIPKTSHFHRGPAETLDLPSMSFSAIDDRLVEVGNREEMVRGRRVLHPPGEISHASCLSNLNFLVIGHLRKVEWVGAVHLLTRWSEDSDFCVDLSVRPVGRESTDPGQLEALAFEVIYEPSHEITHFWREDIRDRDCIYKHTPEELRERAEEISLRGVPLFGVFSDDHEVKRWSPESGDWKELAADAVIEHECFVRPVPVQAIFDHEKAEDAVIEVLCETGDSVFSALAVKKIDRMVCSAKRQAISTVLAARGISLSDEERRRIHACYEAAELDRWLAKALMVEKAAEIWQKS